MNIRAKIFGAKTPEQPVLRTKQPKGVAADALDSIPVEREESRHANNRFEDRHRLASEMARVTHEGESYQVELVNVSGGGAMVSGSFSPKLWDKVQLHLGTHGVVECAVLWLRENRVGLEFAHETHLDCSENEQARLLREVIARSFPDIEYGADPNEQVAPAPSHAPEDEQRVAPRHPLIWTGVLHHDFQSTPVRIRNISQSGAMIESATPVRVGAEPLLEIGEAASVSATVEWNVGDQVGISFHQPFDMELLARSRPELAPVRWERPNYLTPAPRIESPWDPRWGRLSLNELRDELEGFLKR